CKRTPSFHHLYNPERTLNDFPTKVEAVVPDSRVMTKYNITNDGRLFRVSTGVEKQMIIIEGNKPAFAFDYKQDGQWKHCACRVVDIMVLSFYKDLYEDGAKLLDVLHHDRDPTLLRIDTLVPIFTWPQLQSYCIYRLNLIDGENFRVAQSKYPDRYTLPKYLVGDRGSIFSLITLAMMTPEAGTYAMFNLTPTYQNDAGKIRKKRVQGHVLVASTFLDNMGQDMEVHRINRHPRDNTVRNLVCLTHEEHVAAHAGLPPTPTTKMC
ncbi:hypothetical protein V8B55DRAFT_1335106, partial [Mucor lusitanicus]